MSGFEPFDFQRSCCPSNVLALLGLICVGSMVGCAPALNWREVRGSQADVVASFPCKPDLHVRQVRLEGLDGTLLPMTLRVCDVDGLTFAMTEVDVKDPARVPTVMKNLLLGYASNIGVSTIGSVRQDWGVKGMTPQPDGGRWQFEGAMPSGKSVQAETGLVSRGTVIVQVNVSGPTVTPDAAKLFFESFLFQSP